MQFINILHPDCDVKGALHSDCMLFFLQMPRRTTFVRLFTRPAAASVGLGTRLVCMAEHWLRLASKKRKCEDDQKWPRQSVRSLGGPGGGAFPQL